MEDDMDLFDRPDKNKELNPDGSVTIHFKSNGKFNVTVNDNMLTIEPKGMRNSINRGVTGAKTINLDAVTGTQLKEPGMTTGYLQIIMPGMMDARGGVLGAVRDENSILFAKKELPLITELKEYVDTYVAQKNQPQQTTVVNESTGLDELKKLKELLDMGAIDPEEYELAKIKILSNL